MRAPDYEALAAWADAAAARVSEPRTKAMLTQQAQAIREAATLRAENARLLRFLNRVEGECALAKSRSDLHRKRAMEDLHRSEEQHQEGRWHMAQDILDFIERERAAFAAKEPGR